MSIALFVATQQLSPDSITELINQTTAASFTFGLMLGIVVIAVLVSIALSSSGVKFKRDVKKYLYHLPAEKRKDIEDRIASLQKELDTLSNDTNTKYFKSMYNRIMYLQEYLKYKEVK